MRIPTPNDISYKWYRNALIDLRLGLEVEVHDNPECGWFKRKLVAKGPWVPAKIWMDFETDPKTGELLGDEVMRCEVNGNYKDPADQWQWLCANPITEKDYNYLTKLRTYAAEHAPDEPLANPRRPIDWLKVALPIFNRSK